jgi:hypothetical protein
MERANGLPDAQTGWIAKLLYRALKKRLGLAPKAKELAAYRSSTLLASIWMDAACASARTVPAAFQELA